MIETAAASWTGRPACKAPSKERRMTKPDDAVWIAAAGGTRVEGSLAAAVSYEERGQFAFPDPAPPGPVRVPAPVAEPEPVVEPARPVEEVPARPVDHGVAGSTSPALRAMRGRDRNRSR